MPHKPFSSKDDLNKKFWENIHFCRVVVWYSYGVKWMISQFFKASIPPYSLYSIHPLTITSSSVCFLFYDLVNRWGSRPCNTSYWEARTEEGVKAEGTQPVIQYLQYTVVISLTCPCNLIWICIRILTNVVFIFKY